MLASFAVTVALAMLAQDAPAALQSCVFEETGWVCHYRAGDRVVTPRPAPPPAANAETDAEKARRERLIRRCADASWVSLCTPGDRREARALQAEAEARARLRGEVTGLVAAGQCPAAVNKALEGGDMALAREVRDFCARP